MPDPVSKSFLQRALGRASFGIRRAVCPFQERIDRYLGWLGLAVMPVPPAYYEDQLCSLHDHSFTRDERFRRAYNRAVEASGGVDHGARWRTHILLWVAGQAASLEGDFVECGVNTGFMSTAMLNWLPWESLGKTLYLLDTFSGPVAAQYSADERNEGKWEQASRLIEAGSYQMDADSIREHFAHWRSVRVVAGAVPKTLAEIQSESIAFLHLDMNCAAPELAAIEYLWPRIVSGGFVLLDDYAHAGYASLKRAYDEFADRFGIAVLSLPTGQGLIQKASNGAG